MIGRATLTQATSPAQEQGNYNGIQHVSNTLCFVWFYCVGQKLCAVEHTDAVAAIGDPSSELPHCIWWRLLAYRLHITERINTLHSFSSMRQCLLTDCVEYAYWLCRICPGASAIRPPLRSCKTNISSCNGTRQTRRVWKNQSLEIPRTFEGLSSDTEIMALSVLTGPSALVSVGVSTGDVATLISLGNRFGNWWTSSEGDKKLLENLDIDGGTIFRRQGLIDLARFNKRWRKRIRMLANNRPLDLAEPEIARVLGDSKSLLGDLSLFSSVFICITSALDRFIESSVAQTIIYNVLRELVGAAEIGEDLLRAEFSPRINGWRSTACLRGMINASEAFRQKLMDDKSILVGLMPGSDSRNVEQFLLWLVNSREGRFVTSSSDVAGIAACLAHLGIDVIDVQGRGFGTDDESRPCTVVYSQATHLAEASSGIKQNMAIIARAQVVTVPIVNPEESVSIFPSTGQKESDRYRRAWEAGKRSAHSVRIAVQSMGGEVMYSFVDQGSEMQRTRTEISDLAHNHAIAVNAEIIRELENHLRDLDEHTLRWIDHQTGDGTPHPSLTADDITDPSLTDRTKIVAFTTFQSFFMGYFYNLFSRLVDTSTLVLRTVDGAWGFRSPEFLRYMRTDFVQTTANSKSHPGAGSPATSAEVLRTRHQIIPIISRLFLGTTLDIPSYESGCMGIIRGRTLLINSFLGKCKTPQEVGKFTLLDVDVGGLPRDYHGLIRSGLPDPINDQHVLEPMEASKLAKDNVGETGPAEDVTFNIEADWGGNPETALVCVRFKGRRIVNISPETADVEFLRAYAPPATPFRQRSFLGKGIGVGVHSLIGDDQSLRLTNNRDNIPVVFQALGQMRLRYTAVALYSCLTSTYLVADCIRTTADLAVSQYNNQASKSGKRYRSLYGPVLIAGILAATSDDEQHELFSSVEPKDAGKMAYRWFFESGSVGNKYF